MTAEAVATTFSWTYLIGIVITMVVIRSRAGVGQGRIKVFGDGGFGPVWFAVCVISMIFWPITLAVWLARGRPEPRVVFNHRAEERLRRQSTGT